MSTTPPPQRLLIIRNDNIGDMVLTLPMFEAARAAWPAAHLALLTRDYVAPLAECSPHLNELLVDQPRDSVWQLARRLRAGRYDTAIVINASKRICLA
ncbi:MAG TPA: hypothetical protein VL096_18985, partial [Pirellulaceae bacterium]|nr:hypothetical protein [Pirellulaceae bacterium]